MHTTKAVGYCETVCGHLRSTWRAPSLFEKTTQSTEKGEMLQALVARSMQESGKGEKHATTILEDAKFSTRDQSVKEGEENPVRGYQRALDGTAQKSSQQVPITSENIYYESDVRPEYKGRSIRSGVCAPGYLRVNPQLERADKWTETFNPSRAGMLRAMMSRLCNPSLDDCLILPGWRGHRSPVQTDIVTQNLYDKVCVHLLHTFMMLHVCATLSRHAVAYASKGDYMLRKSNSHIPNGHVRSRALRPSTFSIHALKRGVRSQILAPWRVLAGMMQRSFQERMGRSMQLFATAKLQKTYQPSCPPAGRLGMKGVHRVCARRRRKKR